MNFDGNKIIPFIISNFETKTSKYEKVGGKMTE